MSWKPRWSAHARRAAILVPLVLGASCLTSPDGISYFPGCTPSAYDEATRAEEIGAADTAATDASSTPPDALNGITAEAECTGSAAEVRACELGFDWNGDGPLEPGYDQDLSNQGGYTPPPPP
jgi:hypothetical protein